eukprot:TRINITY_DN4625_c0_g1_i4.p1 TRINITY_DN4625_c0_g1~~TRINITY_DN4625_c0_g1_i4.p1  ORF type:complete len:522 (+),score=134.37 TRINITY_DN4625_c0_g1_i4:39-1604(+)
MGEADDGDGYGIEEWNIEYGDLEFYNMVGKGNFGCVYSGEYIGTPVAIKKVEQQNVADLPEESVMDEELAAKYLHRELSVLKSIHHPNVVQFMGVCSHSSGVYLITEWVGGGDLRKLIKARNIPITWRERVEIAKDTAIAMSYLHAKKCIHRDLKPANLLLTEHGRVKVCDMGLARTIQNEQEKLADEGNKKYYTIAGTDVWMAPEVILGEAYDSKCDVYSFGCVVYALIKRHSPPSRKPSDGFGMQPDVLLADIPKQCPQKLVQIMQDCMEYETQFRPPFREICQRLKALLGEMPEHEEEEETHIEIEGERIEIETIIRSQEAERQKQKKSQAAEEEERRKKQEEEHAALARKAAAEEAEKAKQAVAEAELLDKKRAEEELRRQKAAEAAAAAAKQQAEEDGLAQSITTSSSTPNRFGAESLRNRRFALLLQAVEQKDAKSTSTSQTETASTTAPPTTTTTTAAASTSSVSPRLASSASSPSPKPATSRSVGPKSAAAASEAARNKRFAALLSMINDDAN